MGGEEGCKKDTPIPGIPNALLLQTIVFKLRFKEQVSQMTPEKLAKTTFVDAC